MIVGVCNAAAWKDPYQDWALEEGPWELVAPEKPTMASGGCIAKYLYAPGPYIPPSFPRTIGGEMGGTDDSVNAESHHFPADAWADVSRSTQYAAPRRIPADPLQRPAREPSEILLKNMEKKKNG